MVVGGRWVYQEPVTDYQLHGAAHVASGDLKRRVDDLLSAGTVDLQRICGPEAAAIVAAIEAGR